MKNLIAIIFASVFLFSCGNTSSPKHHSSKPDTVMTVVTAIYNLDLNDIRQTKAARIIKDSIQPDSLDKTKNVVLVDTGYWVPVVVPSKDSSGRVLMDTAGKPKLQEVYYLIDKKWVLHDFNKNFLNNQKQ